MSCQPCHAEWHFGIGGSHFSGRQWYNWYQPQQLVKSRELQKHFLSGCECGCTHAFQSVCLLAFVCDNGQVHSSLCLLLSLNCLSETWIVGTFLWMQMFFLKKQILWSNGLHKLVRQNSSQYCAISCSCKTLCSFFFSLSLLFRGPQTVPWVCQLLVSRSRQGSRYRCKWMLCMTPGFSMHTPECIYLHSQSNNIYSICSKFYDVSQLSVILCVNTEVGINYRIYPLYLESPQKV